MGLRIVTFIVCLILYMGKDDVKSPHIHSLSTAITMDSLIASYYFNGDVVDDLGFYNGSLHGAEVSTDRFSSTVSAFRYDGKNDHLDLGVDFTDVYDSLSVSIWIYPFTSCEPLDTLTIDTAQNQYFLSSGGIDESTGIYGVWNHGSLLVGQNLISSHSAHEYHAFLDDGNWHHIVMFFDAANEEASIHINGNFAFSLAYEVGSSSAMIDPLYLGGPNFEGASGFWGKIDDVKFYNRKLSEMEIDNLYKENCPNSLSFSDLHVQSDTLLYAQSFIQIDSLKIDSACNVDLVTPFVHLMDSSYIEYKAQMKIWNMEGCNHAQSVHSQHETHRGIYINNFVTDGILGNEGKEDSLITWCLLQEFNNAYLYNLGTALSSGMQEALDSFVHKANNLSLDITFVSSGFGTSFDNIVAFHQDYDHIPQGIVSEIEFWNGAGDYDTDYAPWLARLDSLKLVPPLGDTISLNPEMSRRFYIGKIKNPGQPPSITIAEDLILHHDEIFLTNYHSDAFDLSTSTSENSIRNKLSLLGQAAKNLEREVNIVILFNVRQDSPAPNIWTYYSEDNDDHDFRAGYEKWYHDFINATDIDYKEFINLKGYGVYRWTDAIEARSYSE